MNKHLVKLANHLNSKGFHKEADYVDCILKKAAEEDSEISDEDSEILQELEDLRSEFLSVSGPEKEDTRREFRDYLAYNYGYNKFLETKDPKYLNGLTMDFNGQYSGYEKYATALGYLNGKIEASEAAQILQYDGFSIAKLIMERLKTTNRTLTEEGAKVLMNNFDNIEKHMNIHKDFESFKFSKSGEKEAFDRNKFFLMLINTTKSEDRKIKNLYKEVMQKLDRYCRHYIPHYDEIPDDGAYSPQQAFNLIKQEYEKVSRRSGDRDRAVDNIVYYIKSSLSL